METAVLLPQDCLHTYRRRHKHQSHDMICQPESVSSARRSSLQGTFVNYGPHASISEQAGRRKTISANSLLVKGKDAGLLPLPHHSSSLPINIPLLNNSEARRVKSKALLQSSFDVPSFTLLQRPKHKETTNAPPPVITILQRPKKQDVQRDSDKIVKDTVSTGQPKESSTPEVFVAEGLLVLKNAANQQSNASPRKIVKDTVSTGHVKESSNPEVFVAEGLLVVKDAAKQQSNVSARKIDKKPRPPKQLKPPSLLALNEKQIVKRESNGVESKKTVARQEFVPKASTSSSSVVPKMKSGSAMLDRPTSLDTEVVNTVLEHWQITQDVSKGKESKADMVVTAAKMSDKERWAGPAYTTSPSPSSLPLPKFSLPIPRVSSPGLGVADMEMMKIGYADQKLLSTSLPSFKAEAWDTAVATKSLRRLLNLDPPVESF